LRCGVGDHALQIVETLLTGSYVNWGDAQLLRAYQSQNPGFTSWADAGGPNDQGMDVQAFLSWMVKQGLILGFAKIDPTNEDEVKAAVWLFLASSLVRTCRSRSSPVMSGTT